VTGVAERLSQDAGAPPASDFVVSPAWFEAWDAAYLAPARRIDLGGLALLDMRATVGPVPFRLRHARTNPHTALFDTAAHLPDVQTILRGADVVSLDYVPEGSPLLTAAREWCRTYHVRVAPHARVPVVDCRRPYSDWLAARSKRLRQRWPRLEREAFGEHGLTYERLSRFDDLPMLLAHLFALEQAGWKGREKTAIADSAADTLFYTQLATRAAAAGALRIALLRAGERIVAFEYAVLGGDRLYVLKVSYDEAYEHASIGHVLAARHIRDCCEDSEIAWYDQLGNGLTPAPYKLRYADVVEERFRITLYASNARGSLAWARDGLRARAKRLRDRWKAKP
jgi:CelD/BcsL family acetyltransferase involved in cellulose biosynthesis